MNQEFYDDKNSTVFGLETTDLIIIQLGRFKYVGESYTRTGRLC